MNSQEIKNEHGGHHTGDSAAASKASTAYLPDSPPSYEKLLKEGSSSSLYAGRSSYLREEALREKNLPAAAAAVSRKATTAVTAAPGMYENDADREGLRQMLNSLRKVKQLFKKLNSRLLKLQCRKIKRGVHEIHI